MPRTPYRLPEIYTQADADEEARKAREEAERLEIEAREEAEATKRKPRTIPDDDAVIILHKAGLSNRQIADKLNCAASAIDRRVRDYKARTEQN